VEESIVRKNREGARRVSGAGMSMALMAVTVVPLATLAFGSLPAEASSSLVVYVPDQGSGLNGFLDVEFPPQEFPATQIAIPGSGVAPNNVAISPDGTTALVTQSGNSAVTAVSTVTNAVTKARIPVGSGPYAVAISPDGTRAYVANQLANSVSVIDMSTLATVGSAIGVGTEPSAVAVTADGSEVLVANQDSSSVSVISTSTDAVVATIGVTGSPQSITVSPTQRIAYVSNSGSETVSEISTASNTVMSTISLSGQPGDVAVTPSGNDIYVSSGSYYQEFDTSTNAQVAKILDSNQPVLVISPDGSEVITDSLGAGMTEISTASNSVAASGFGSSNGPAGLAIPPDQAPIAKLSVTPQPAGSATSLDASASTGPTSPIVSYAWNFGDGGTSTTTGATTTHVYANPGTYTASVTETDAVGTSTTRVFTGQTVSRNGGPGAEAQSTFTVPPPSSPPTISGTPPSPGTKGQPYNFSFTLGGSPSPTTAVSSGSLPPGLGLSSGGVISGSPTKVGSYTTTVTASNGVRPKARTTFTIKVVHASHPKIGHVTFDDSAADPRIVIAGQGFGAHPPSPSYPPGPCPNRGTGSLYGSSFYFADNTRNWDAGQGGSDGLGNCIGLVVRQWSSTKIVFAFGNDYPTSAWVLDAGDGYTTFLYSTSSSGTVAYKP
jgi:YVTN family beta-propeller protein